MKIKWPLIKYTISIILWLSLRTLFGLDHKYCFCALIFLTLSYQNVIAKCIGAVRIPSMDAMTFLSSAKSHVNFMNVVYYDGIVDEATVRFNTNKLAAFMPKFSYKMVECCGEYYYKQMHPDKKTAIDLAFSQATTFNEDPKTMLKTPEDVDLYCQDNLN